MNNVGSTEQAVAKTLLNEQQRLDVLAVVVSTFIPCFLSDSSSGTLLSAVFTAGKCVFCIARSFDKFLNGVLYLEEKILF
jgi:hypothetical protein